MTLRTVTIALLTLALTGSSVVGIQLLARRSGQQSKTVQVVISRKPLERGTTIQPDMVELKAWPEDLLLDGMLTDVNELSERVVLTPVVAGEPLLDDKLALPGVGPMIASLIPQGMRAITIPTPTVSSGVAGFVLPGNRVDVLLTLGNSGARNASEVLTVTVAQNVEILAVNQKTQVPREHHVDLKEMQSVTLLTTLQQASRLQLGQSRGSLHLILRHPDDELVPEPYRACLSELEGTSEESGQSMSHRTLDNTVRRNTGNASLLESTAGLTEPGLSAEAVTPAPVQRFIRTMRGAQPGRVLFEPYFATRSEVPTTAPGERIATQ